MKVIVFGGRLQGVEITYLAHKAGWEVILVDKESNVPAARLCEEFFQLNVLENYDQLISIAQKADMIIPAIEDRMVLECLKQLAKATGIPIAFDSNSYNISSSKLKSDELFLENGIAAPVYWPKANFPVIVKPSEASGSSGVFRINTRHELEEVFRTTTTQLNEWVIQEYLDGPSYSLEIVGYQGQFLTYQITELEMDKDYDCKRVLAPVELDPLLEEQFKEISIQIAEKIGLTGIMDVEVINDDGILKVLEIDARFPSQTPTVVYKSTGINLLEHLFEVFANDKLPVLSSTISARAVIYEHIKVTEKGIETIGEHIMADAGSLLYYKNFWGAEEVLTNYKPGCKHWVATLIITGKSTKEVWTKRSQVIENIKSNIS